MPKHFFGRPWARQVSFLQARLLRAFNVPTKVREAVRGR